MNLLERFKTAPGQMKGLNVIERFSKIAYPRQESNLRPFAPEVPCGSAASCFDFMSCPNFMRVFLDVDDGKR